MTNPMLPRWLEERAKLRAERDQLLGLRDELCEGNAKVGLLNVDLQMRLAAAEEERDAALREVERLREALRDAQDALLNINEDAAVPARAYDAIDAALRAPAAGDKEGSDGAV